MSIVVQIVIASIAIPTLGWMILEFLRLRSRITKQDGKIAKLSLFVMQGEKENLRQQAWLGEVQNTVIRMDRNIVRLCEAQHVQYDC